MGFAHLATFDAGDLFHTEGREVALAQSALQTETTKCATKGIVLL